MSNTAADSKPISKFRMEMLQFLVSDGPKRYSEIKSELKRPDQTITTALKELVSEKLVTKDDQNGIYKVTDLGKERVRALEYFDVISAPDIKNIVEGELIETALARESYLLGWLKGKQESGRKLKPDQVNRLNECDNIAIRLWREYASNPESVDDWNKHRDSVIKSTKVARYFPWLRLIEPKWRAETFQIQFESWLRLANSLPDNSTKVEMMKLVPTIREMAATLGVKPSAGMPTENINRA